MTITCGSREIIQELGTIILGRCENIQNIQDKKVVSPRPVNIGNDTQRTVSVFKSEGINFKNMWRSKTLKRNVSSACQNSDDKRHPRCVSRARIQFRDR